MSVTKMLTIICIRFQNVNTFEFVLFLDEQYVSSEIVTEQEVDISIRLHWEKEKIEKLQKENEKQADKINELEKQMFLIQAENVTFRNASGTKDEILSGDLSKEAIPAVVGVMDALNRFIKILETLAKENYKKNSILEVLQAHATLIATFCYQDVSIILQNMVIQV